MKSELHEKHGARSYGRPASGLRPVRLTRGFTKFAHGSVLVEFGETRVLCTAMVQGNVPGFKVGSGTGWVTAEYAMLPGSTPQRKERKPDGRSTEIQRLIGRVLRAVVDFEALGENSVYVDCDVLQADGGTRTAAITGGYVALADALRLAERRGMLDRPGLTSGGVGEGRRPSPERPQRPILTDTVAAISVGLVGGQALLDLDYREDVDAQVDMNIAMTGGGRYIELQGTGEEATFDEGQLSELLALGRQGCQRLAALQRQALSLELGDGPLTVASEDVGR